VTSIPFRFFWLGLPSRSFLPAMGNEVYLDDTLVRTKELALAMLVSRSTVRNWKMAGYVFQFGRMTTPGHCKAWLRDRADKKQPAAGRTAF
jgi:hypothetical protein